MYADINNLSYNTHYKHHILPLHNINVLASDI